MGMRRRAREAALQMLYQIDAQPELPVDAALGRFYRSFADEAPQPGGFDELQEFADRLVRGVVENLAAIDARISGASHHWRLERMGRVDRNLIRLAVYEMSFCDDIPAKVAINEAIEIAKRYGAQETPAFVNGVLDRVLEDLPKRR
jgi:N utilization substance protein B